MRDTAATYENEDTGVYFQIEWEIKKRLLRGSLVSNASININYYRPSFFGIEAAPEIAKFVERFSPSIEDPQMGGMGSGPYSDSGLLNGWNQGNAFAHRSIIPTLDTPPYGLPTARLKQIWDWNYVRETRQTKVGDDIFVPRIMFAQMKGGVVTLCTWVGAPTELPEVDLIVAPGSNPGESKILPRAAFEKELGEAGITAKAGVFPIHSEAACRALLEKFQSGAEAIPADFSILPVDQILDEELVAQARQSDV